LGNGKKGAAAWGEICHESKWGEAAQGGKKKNERKHIMTHDIVESVRRERGDKGEGK